MSSNGEILAISANGSNSSEGAVFVEDLTTGKMSKIYSPEYQLGDLAVSSDGKYIAYARYDLTSNYGIEIVDVKGKVISSVLSVQGANDSPISLHALNWSLNTLLYLEETWNTRMPNVTLKGKSIKIDCSETSGTCSTVKQNELEWIPDNYPFRFSLSPNGELIADMYATGNSMFLETRKPSGELLQQFDLTKEGLQLELNSAPSISKDNSKVVLLGKMGHDETSIMILNLANMKVDTVQIPAGFQELEVSKVIWLP